MCFCAHQRPAACHRVHIKDLQHVIACTWKTYSMQNQRTGSGSRSCTSVVLSLVMTRQAWMPDDNRTLSQPRSRCSRAAAMQNSSMKLSWYTQATLLVDDHD